MLLKHLMINRVVEQLRQHNASVTLLEDAAGMLNKFATVASGDKGSADGFDADSIADVTTGILLLVNPEFRKSMTADDVGINPNNASELLKMLDSVAENPKDPLTNSKSKQFFKAIALMSKSTRQKQLELVKKAINGERAAVEEIKKFVAKVKAATDSLRAKAKKSA